ncbi:unnamed protein product [Effrenium voratum]|nr:unnamed protein product [Effrenium voratum]
MPVEFSGRPQIEGSRRFAEQCQDEAAKGFSIEVLQNLRPRVPSSGYWASAAWDPDCRVYAGAEIFQTHNLAEQQDQQKQEWPKQQKQQDQQDQQAEHAPMRRGGSASYWGAMVDVLPAEVHFGDHMAGERNAPGQAPEESMSLRLRSSSDYWTSGNWNLELQMGKEHTDTPPTSCTSESTKCMTRHDSNAYWDANQWDPDERVYVGAAAGQTNHLVAVIHGDDKLLRAWAGGLTCESGTCGRGPRDISSLGPSEHSEPELQDLYEVESDSVGFGSFGVVRLARHRQSQTRCVVKSLNKSQTGPSYKAQVDGGLYERLLGMSSTPHEGIVKYLDMLESKDHFYVVMESLHGPELLDEMESLCPVTEAHCQQVMREVLSALAHIHDTVGICHRDIKLDNFRYRSPGQGAQLVLLDFGFLADLDTPWDGKKCGTRMYMAPEVLAETAQQPHLAAIDMWAAGVLLYLLLTGDGPVQPEQLQILAKLDQDAKNIIAEALEAEQVRSASKEAADLLRKLLDLKASSRIRAADALKHPWMSLSLDGASRVGPAKRDSYRTATRSAQEVTLVE